MWQQDIKAVSNSLLLLMSWVMLATYAESSCKNQEKHKVWMVAITSRVMSLLSKWNNRLWNIKTYFSGHVPKDNNHCGDI